MAHGVVTASAASAAAATAAFLFYENIRGQSVLFLISELTGHTPQRPHMPAAVCGCSLVTYFLAAKSHKKAIVPNERKSVSSCTFYRQTAGAAVEQLDTQQ